MSTYVITGEPVSWAAHKGFGKRAYNPRHKERTRIQWELKLQHEGKPLYTKGVHVFYDFEMPMPESFSAKKKKEIEKGTFVPHISRKDLTNLIKFIEDCLIGTVLLDDNVVCAVTAVKFYSTSPKTTIGVIEMND